MQLICCPLHSSRLCSLGSVNQVSALRSIVSTKLQKMTVLFVVIQVYTKPEEPNVSCLDNVQTSFHILKYNQVSINSFFFAVFYWVLPFQSQIHWERARDGHTQVCKHILYLQTSWSDTVDKITLVKPQEQWCGDAGHIRGHQDSLSAAHQEALPAHAEPECPSRQCLPRHEALLLWQWETQPQSPEQANWDLFNFFCCILKASHASFQPLLLTMNQQASRRGNVTPCGLKARSRNSL